MSRETTTRAYHELHGQIHLDEPMGEGDTMEYRWTKAGQEVVEHLTLRKTKSGSWLLYEEGPNPLR